MPKVCLEPGCGLPHYGRGLCKKHHQRMWKAKVLPPVDRQSDAAFFEKVSFEPMSGCWLWMGGEHTHGYGFFGSDGHGRKEYAHRWSYRQFCGAIPPGMEVRHLCNNTHCVNPDHLALGSHQDNMRDMATAGTQKGQRNGGAILTDAQVMEIARRLRQGETQKALALEYRTSKGAIQAIASGKNWAHLTGGPVTRRKVLPSDPKWKAYQKAAYAAKKGDPVPMQIWRRQYGAIS